MILLQTGPKEGNGISSIILIVIIVLIFAIWAVKRLGMRGLYLWALTYNIKHYGHGSFEVDSTIKKIVCKMMKEEGIIANHLDIVHEIGSRYTGTLFSDKGTYNVTILADKSGNVKYNINEKVAD